MNHKTSEQFGTDYLAGTFADHDPMKDDMEAKIIEDVLLEPLLGKYYEDYDDFYSNYYPGHAMTDDYYHGHTMADDCDHGHAMAEETEAEMIERLLVAPLLNTGAGMDYSQPSKTSIFS